MYAKLLSLAALAAVALAAPGGTESSCDVGLLQCCNSVQDASNPTVQTLLGLLGVSAGSITGQVGLTCTPISVIGVGGNSCNAQPVCCTGNNFNGLIALGCTPVNVNL